MNRRKNLTLIFDRFNKEHFGKDVFLVPYYLGKMLQYDVKIIYTRTTYNINFPKEVKGVRLVALNLNKRLSISPLWRNLNYYVYLLRNARKIDILMRFHNIPHSKMMVVLYKFLNPKGIAYVKLDADTISNEKDGSRKNNSLKNKLNDVLSSTFLKMVDRVSCETSDGYETLKNSTLPQYQFGEKLRLMPNGFDEELLELLNIKERSFEEKENLIITVGRLGTPQKNTEMLLKALTQIDLKDWKVYLIGPVEKDFQTIVDNFFKQYPEKANKVIFTGPIYNKKELWEYYNRAKVFVLTSKWESYALVLNEAQRFHNYLVSTPVGAFEDLYCHGKYGKKVLIDNDKELALILSDIVNRTQDINVYQEFDVTSLSWKNQVKLLDL